MDDLLKHREVDVPGGLTLHICNQQPSITGVLRAVKREEHGIFNCITSIVHDSEFVQQVRAQFAPFPLLTNLRCGSWYAPDPDGTCYFKSTDGHIGQWSFSTVRLNLHVAELALRHGGVCIVDSTRRGKRFPDALSKTIPIWAAVLNQAAKFRFVKKLSQQQQQQQQQYSGLHIPPWIPRNESNEINKQMQTWVESFLALGLDLKNLEPLLQRPLRCVWISQDDDEWTKHSLNNGSNLYDGFTPIILINASLPNHRQRRRLRVARMNVDVMYDYIPGAGDDEETWANGLTPPVLWAHLDEILQGGPRNANAIAARMKRQHSNGEKKCDICLNAYCGHTTSCLAMEYHSVPDHSVNSWTLQWIGDPVGLGIANIRQATDDTDTENPHELTNSGGVHFSGDDRIVDKHAVVWLVDKETEESLGQSTASAVTHFVMRSNSRTHLGKDKYFPEQLRGCIDFVSKHLAAGENILVKTDRQGFSVAGAILLACMIACYEINHEDGDGDDYGDDDRDGDVRRTLRWSGPFKQSVEGNGLSLLPASCLAVGNLTRKLMKKYLANITARYPQLIVSKGLLRQVFNIFAVGNQVK